MAFGTTRLVIAFAATMAIAIPALAGPPTPIAEAARGTSVIVAGTVERIDDEDEFTLTDASGSIRVYVGPNPVPATVGEAVTVEGLVDDDLFSRELYARTLTGADGQVVTFRRDYQ